MYFWISAFDHRAIVVPKMHIVHWFTTTLTLLYKCCKWYFLATYVLEVLCRKYFKGQLCVPLPYTPSGTSSFLLIILQHRAITLDTMTLQVVFRSLLKNTEEILSVIGHLETAMLAHTCTSNSTNWAQLHIMKKS